MGAGSSYRLIYKVGPGAGDDYGDASPVTVKDASGADITGTISASSIAFNFLYDTDTLGGTAATDKAVVLIGIRPGHGKFKVAEGTLARSKSMAFSLAADKDPTYV